MKYWWKLNENEYIEWKINIQMKINNNIIKTEYLVLMNDVSSQMLIINIKF